MIRWLPIMLVACAGFMLPPRVYKPAVRSVTLAWEASPDTNVAGYNLYVGSASKSYSRALDAGTNLTCVVTNLVVRSNYYFAATAYDAWGLESDFSEELAYVAPPRINTNTNVVVTISTPSGWLFASADAAGSWLPWGFNRMTNPPGPRMFFKGLNDEPVTIARSYY